MLTSQLKNILLVFGLLVLYPNINVPLQVTQARFIQNFPQNEVSVEKFRSEKFLPVTKKEKSSQEVMKRDRFLTKDMKLKESSYGKRPVHSKHEDLYFKKDTWEDEDSNVKKSAKRGKLDSGYKNEKDIPLNLKNDNRIKIVFEEPKDDSQTLDSKQRDRFVTEERKLKDSSFGGNSINEKRKDVYYKKDSNKWEDYDNSVKEAAKKYYLDLVDSLDRDYDKYEKEVPLKLKNDNLIKIVVEDPKDDYQETPRRDPFFPKGLKLKDSSLGYSDSDPLNRDYDKYEKELPLKLKNDNRIKIIFEDANEDSEKNDDQITQRNRFLTEGTKLKDLSFGRQPGNAKHEDTYYKKESNAWEEDDNNGQERIKSYDKYEKEPLSKQKNDKQIKIIIQGSNDDFPTLDSEQNHRQETIQEDHFLEEDMKLKDTSLDGYPGNAKHENIFIGKESKTWDSSTLTDIENETSTEKNYPKYNIYSGVLPLEGNSTAENPNNTSLLESSINKTVLAVDNLLLEVNTVKSKPALNLTLKLLSDVKPTDSTNQKQKKAAGYYVERVPNRDTGGMMELRKKKSEEGIGNGDPNRPSIGSFPRDPGPLKSVISPPNLPETASEVSQLRSFVEVRNQLQPEKDMSNVIYVEENKKEKERDVRESCDSLSCKIFTTKVLCIGIFIVFAAIGALVFFILTNKNSSLRKYMRLDSSDENGRKRSRSPKRKKKPIGESTNDHNKPSPLDSAKKSSVKPNNEMNHPDSNSDIKLLIENGNPFFDGLEKHSNKQNNKANRSDESKKRTREHSNGAPNFTTDETKRKEMPSTQSADKRQEPIKSVKGGYNAPQPKPLEGYSTEPSIEMTKDKKLKNKVMQWLQDTVSDVEPEYPSLEEYKSDLFCNPPGNSVEPKSSHEMGRLKHDVHTIIDALDIPSEEIPQQLTHRELQKSMIVTGANEEVDQMLVSGKWGRSLLTGHGFHTIGHLKMMSKMPYVGPEDKKEIDMEKLAKFRENNEMGTIIKNKSSHSTQLTDVVREVEAEASKSKNRSNKRNRQR